MVIGAPVDEPSFSAIIPPTVVITYRKIINVNTTVLYRKSNVT